MTVTADPQSTPAMNGWATPQERDPATEIDRLRMTGPGTRRA